MSRPGRLATPQGMGWVAHHRLSLRVPAIVWLMLLIRAAMSKEDWL